MSVPESDVSPWNLLLDTDQFFSFDYSIYQYYNAKISPEKDCPEYSNHNNSDYQQNDAKISPKKDCPEYSNYNNRDYQQYDAKISPDNDPLEYSKIDNNDYNAPPLQEELQNLSISVVPEPLLFTEPTRFSTPEYPQGQYHQSINIPQDWYTPDTNYYKGIELSVKEVDEIGDSSPDKGLNNEEEHSYCLEINDDDNLSEEVDKKLNQMVPVPHIPKINGDIPSIDDAISNHQRLQDRLEACNLVEHIVEGDGNCQFRALSDQVYQTPEHHLIVRKKVVRQLKASRDMYEGYVPMPFNKYLKRMYKSGEWGDHVTLQAAADLYGMKIVIITSFKDTCYLEILPKIQKSQRVICLSFWSEVHYNSIYPREGSSRDSDLLPSESKKKKEWWSF